MAADMRHKKASSAGKPYWYHGKDGNGLARLTHLSLARVSALKAGKANHKTSTERCYFCAILKVALHWGKHEAQMNRWSRLDTGRAVPCCRFQVDGMSAFGGGKSRFESDIGNHQGVEQLECSPRLERGGRWFKSNHPDQYFM